MTKLGLSGRIQGGCVGLSRKFLTLRCPAVYLHFFFSFSFALTMTPFILFLFFLCRFRFGSCDAVAGQAVVFLQGYVLVYMGSHSALVSDVERRTLSYHMAIMFFFMITVVYLL